jgi:two-component system chemotaxis response regulator CheY
VRILVSDDELVARKITSTLLSEYGECDEAEDGEAALEMFQKALSEGSSYGLVTIDVGMPKMGGLELLRAITLFEKKRSMWPSRKIMISADSHAKTVIQAVQGKCDAYLVKPVQPENLKKKLEKMDIYPRSK